MLNRLGYIIALVTTLATAVPVEGRQSAQSTNDTFTWLSELVSVDAAARTMTVKSRIAYQDAVSGLKQFKAGEPVWVVWSGSGDRSDAVRQFRRAEANRTITEELVMPAELVSPEATNHYATLRVKVPESALAAIAKVKPGEWVTVTSRQRPVTDAEAVVGVKPYSESSTSTASTD